MGGPQRNLFKTCKDALDDRLDLHPQMGAGPPEQSTGPLQIGDLICEEVLPRRGGYIVLIVSSQILSDCTPRPGSVAAPKNVRLELGPRSFFLEQGPEASSIG